MLLQLVVWRPRLPILFILYLPLAEDAAGIKPNKNRWHSPFLKKKKRAPFSHFWFIDSSPPFVLQSSKRRRRRKKKPLWFPTVCRRVCLLFLSKKKRAFHQHTHKYFTKKLSKKILKSCVCVTSTWSIETLLCNLFIIFSLFLFFYFWQFSNDTT